MSNGFVYIQSEPQLWTVGHYDGAGKFQPESDHHNIPAAVERCRVLNGGSVPDKSLVEVRKTSPHIRDQDPLFYAQVCLFGRDLFLWKDGSLRRCATTRFVKDQKDYAYFKSQAECVDNIKRHLLGGSYDIDIK